MTFKPLPSGSFRGLCGGDGGAQRGPSEHRERKKGVRTEAHPINPLSLDAHATHPPLLPPAEALSVSVRRGPHCERAAAEEKGPLVVNNSAVHSDHNGGTSHCFEHLLRVGIGPLAARQR